MSLPIITVVGNLKNIELKYTSSGKAVCSFQVECAEKNSKGDYQNLYLRGECWEKSAEFVNQYFSNGSVAIVTGKLFTNVYAKKDGTKVYENKLLFPNVSFPPKDRSESNSSSSQQRPTPQVEYQNAQGQTQQRPTYQQQMPQQPNEIDIDPEGIPF